MNKTVCNVCGKEFDIWDRQEAFGFHSHVGYGSKFDGDHIELDLCCDCFDNLMDELIPKCVHNPVVDGDTV